MEPIVIDQDVRRDIAKQGFAWIPRVSWSLSPAMDSHWQRLCRDWDCLEVDRYLAHGARFRLRRYGRYHWSPADDALAVLPHKSYYQPEDENPYAGGVMRNLAPLLRETADSPFLHALVRSTFACLPLSGDREGNTWEVRVHLTPGEDRPHSARWRTVVW